MLYNHWYYSECLSNAQFYPEILKRIALHVGDEYVVIYNVPSVHCRFKLQRKKYCQAMKNTWYFLQKEIGKQKFKIRGLSLYNCS